MLKLAVVVCLFTLLDASGFFELQILGIHNIRGELMDGSCCGRIRDKDAACIRQCNTYFRVCLKEYRSQAMAEGDCTFGNKSTDVISGNSFSVHTAPDKEVILKLPFTFRWTRSFTLILDAMDYNNRTKPFTNDIIERHVYSGIIVPGSEWHTLLHQGTVAKISYRLRVMCDANYYNVTCMKFCRPLDNIFGHNTCNSQGEKVCLPGWTGANCEKAICKPGCHPVHGYCEKPGECQCRPGWKSELCDQCMPYPGCKHGYCNGSPWQCICDINWGGILCDQDLNYCGTRELCQNGGTCENNAPDEYMCRCPEGFSGVNCEIVDNPCATSPCWNGGMCSEINGTFSCTCAPGWMGPMCKQNINECESNPCANGGTCGDLVNGYHCLCRSGWEGARCQLDADECKGEPCKNAKSCENVVGDYVCTCQSGWTGKNCDQNINDCIGQCQNGATCIDLVNDYHCACLPGFTGRDCQTNINECASDPCLNGGECVDNIASFHCICPVGYKGLRCEIDNDLCNPNPCEHGASCFNMQWDYYCHCPEDFQGKNCSIPRPKCHSSNCETLDSCLVPIPEKNGKTRLAASNVCGEHGKCISEMSGGFTCVCDPGYTGRYCHENINDCGSNPCKNGGTCLDRINSFQCLCREGWEGSICDINKNECNPNPCRNNGTCLDAVADFICKCRHGWKGKTCNLRNSHCDISTCQNGGTCIDLGHSFACRCTTGWEGHTCHISQNPSCHSNPCQNGATCINIGNNFSCMCKEGFEGPLCQNNKDDCSQNPCYNGGKCIDGINWFMCECAQGFTGPDCRININECATSPCVQGSTCIDGIGDFTCICPPGRSGRLCNSLLTETLHMSCEFQGISYSEGSFWEHDCNSCQCQNGRVFCTQVWCGIPNCLHHANTTEEIITCEKGQICIPTIKNACFTPPCPPRGECRWKDNNTHTSVLPITGCMPGIANPSNNCAKITLLFEKPKMPQGITVEDLCKQLRKLSVHKTILLSYSILILCAVREDDDDVIEVAVSTPMDPSLETYAVVSGVAKNMADIISRKMSNSSALSGVIEVKVETSMVSPENKGQNYLISVLVSFIALMLFIVTLGIGIWYYMHHCRQKKSQTPNHSSPCSISSKLDQLDAEGKSNNQNKENIRRYRNSLHTNDKLCSMASNDSTELTEIDYDTERANIPSGIYKAQSLEAKKNTAPNNANKKDFEKDNNLKAHQRQLSDKEVIV